MSPWKKAIWLAKFTLACAVLLVVIPGVIEYSVGGFAMLWANSDSNRAAIQKHHDAHVRELRAALPTCTEYRETHPLPGPLPAGDWHEVNQRGDWLCQ